MAKRITQTIRREILGVETGELVKVDTQKTFTEKVTPENFYMTFIDYAAPLYQLKSEVARKLLTWLCSHATYNTGIIDLSATTREEICKDLDITNNQITNNLKTLKNLNLITGEKGRFQINPEIFWKGDMKSRAEAMKNKSLKISFELIEN